MCGAVDGQACMLYGVLVAQLQFGRVRKARSAGSSGRTSRAALRLVLPAGLWMCAHSLA
jgi:hypothetical protein